MKNDLLLPDYAGLDNKTLFERALSDFDSVYLVVIYHPDVVLPESIMTAGWRDRKVAIILEYGLNLVIPIMDLQITDVGVTATLSFSRDPFVTVVPWEAVVRLQCSGRRLSPPKARPKLGLVK